MAALAFLSVFIGAGFGSFAATALGMFTVRTVLRGAA
jgi:hypothetical protein